MTSINSTNLVDLVDLRNGIFLHAVKKFGVFPGKKAMHKILYFIDTNSHNFSYRWDKFGPFSDELKYIFEDAVADGLLEIHPSSLSIRDGKQYNMQLSQKGFEFTENYKLDPIMLQKINYVHEFLKKEFPRQMELLASIHFLVEDNDCNTSPEFIFNILTTLKPNSGFTRNDINTSISKLREYQFISKAT